MATLRNTLPSVRVEFVPNDYRFAVNVNEPGVFSDERRKKAAVHGGRKAMMADLYEAL